MLIVSFSTLIITFLVILMNIRAPEEDKFSIIEYIFALVFGWIAVVYILITYNKYIFNFKETKWMMKIKQCLTF